MNIWNIILKQEKADSFDIPISTEEHKLVIPIDTTMADRTLLSTNVFDEFASMSIIPANNAFDLLIIALGIYTVDQVISRKQYGYQGWSRHFKIYIPVNSKETWDKVKDDIENMLSFLSGDKWEIYFRQNTDIRQVTFPIERNQNNADTVSLFSGGLDSFIGAIDLLEDKKRVVFVSHYKGGSESPVQTELYSFLSNIYGTSAFEKHKFRVQPNQKHKDVTKEGSSRARSFLFLSLGIVIANSLGDNIHFVIPENGFISLNVPLTSTRLSSHSTRTTHPYYINIFKKVLLGIGITNPISNPYQFCTKGEMMSRCKNQDFLRLHYEKTVSCSHPDNSHFIKGKKPGIHCGYCVPCIIRQASENKSGIHKTEYSRQIKTDPPDVMKRSGRDLRAFKIAIEKFSTLKTNSIVLELLNSGPLPFSDESELSSYIAVYERGMKEVADFLK